MWRRKVSVLVTMGMWLTFGMYYGSHILEETTIMCRLDTGPSIHSYALHEALNSPCFRKRTVRIRTKDGSVMVHNYVQCIRTMYVCGIIQLVHAHIRRLYGDLHCCCSFSPSSSSSSLSPLLSFSSRAYTVSIALHTRTHMYAHTE